MSTLACGHEPSQHSESATGTAVLPDGSEVCWECADAWQLNQMRTATKVVLYLSSDGARVTSWSGGSLGSVLRRVTRRVGFGRTTRDYVTVRDNNGRLWHGTSPGPHMYCRLTAKAVQS